MRSLGKLAFAGVSLLAISVPAFAQPVAAPAEAGDGDEPLTVIGTLIRGTEAVGAQTISVDQTTIVEKGAGTTNELLGALPQLAGTFNGRFEIDPRGFGTGTNSINKPNLRSLPATGGGTTTLVTMDGMRLTPVGVNDAATDVDVIPSNILAGIDAVTDGGSSLYGADAVGGVLNFKTLRKFEGVKLDFNYSFGTKLTSFRTWDGAITAGTSWSSGNAYVTASHYDRSGVINADVPWSSGLVYSVANPNGVFASTQCINPVSSIVNYAYYGQWTNNAAAPGAGRVPVGTPCDQVGSETYTPATKRTNVFAAITQDFSDAVSLRVTGYWAKRDMYFKHYPVGASTADAVFVAPPGPPPPIGTVIATQGGTGFSFGRNAAYVNRDNVVSFETWGVTPELTVKLGEAWQVRAGLHYGRSFNFNRFASADTAKTAAYITGGQLDPFNVQLASPAVINDITDFESANDTKQEMFVARLIGDGPLFAMPHGDVKLAVGVEYQFNKAEVRSQLGKVGSINSLPYIGRSRNAKSIFAEIQIPVLEVLDLTASGRYDHYSDFGSTFNPNLGATFKPADWIKIFGHWNTSYNAPTALDSIGLGSGRLACGQYIVNGTPGTSQRPTDPLGRDTSRQGTCALILTGGRPEGIKPQTAKSWAIGIEVEPLPRLKMGMEFYHIDFNNVIGTINPANLNTYATNPEAYIYNLTQGQYQSYINVIGNGGAILGQQPLASNIALVVDARQSNLNSARIRGVDFHVNYDFDTSFGNIELGVNGNVPTRAIVSQSGVVTNELGHLNPLYTISTFAALRKDRWTVRATVNVRGKFDAASADYLGRNIEADPFVMTNLFIGYKIEDSSGPLNGTSFRLNVDNLFDKEPQRVKLANTNFPSYVNWTLGRVIKLGVSKAF